MHRYRIPTPVLVVGTVASLVGILTVLNVVEPAQSRAPIDICSRFAEESRELAAAPIGSGRSIAVIGDSYAAGLALGDPRSSWASRLPGRVQVFAFSGSGFSPLSSRCQAVDFYERAGAVAALEPEVVVIEGGLNDVGQSEREIRSGFRKVILELQGREVLVVGPALAPSRDQGALRVDRILRQIAEQTRTPYLSMIGKRFDYLPDNLHLTPAGHQEFGELVAKRLRTLTVRPPKS